MGRYWRYIFMLPFVLLINTQRATALDSEFFSGSDSSVTTHVATTPYARDERTGEPFPIRMAVVNPEGTMKNLCGAGAVGKKVLDANSCEFALQTAAHCVNHPFSKIEFETLKISIAHQPGALRVDIPESARNQVSLNTPPPNDVALIFITAACDLIRDDQIFALAPIGINGKVALKMNEGVFSLSRFLGPTRGVLNGISYSSNQQGATVTRGRVDPGDSGSPIWNALHEIVGSISGGAGEKQFTFPTESLAWVKLKLESWVPGSTEKGQAQASATPGARSLTGGPADLAGLGVGMGIGAPQHSGGMSSDSDRLASLGGLPPGAGEIPGFGQSFAPRFRSIRADAGNQVEALDVNGKWGTVILEAGKPLRTDSGASVAPLAIQELVQGYRNTANPQQFFGAQFPLVSQFLQQHGSDFAPDAAQNPNGGFRGINGIPGFSGNGAGVGAMAGTGGRPEFSSGAQQPGQSIRIPSSVGGGTSGEPIEFECVASETGTPGGSSQPRIKSDTERAASLKRAPKGLGQFAYPEKATCERAVAVSRNGVVCAQSQPNGWKLTHFSGSTENNPAYGYWGWPTTFEECLLATENSTPEKLCYGIGPEPYRWLIGNPNGSKAAFGTEYRTVNECIAVINPAPRRTTEAPKGERSRGLPDGLYPQPIKLAPGKIRPREALGENFSAVGKIITQSCTNCHDGSKGPQKAKSFPNYVTDGAAWAKIMDDSADPRHAEAKEILRSFYQNVVQDETMLNRGYEQAFLEKRQFPEREKNALATFVTDQAKKHLGASFESRISTTLPASASGNSGDALHLVNPAKMTQYEGALAKLKITNPMLADLLNHYDVMYDKTGMPSARQRPESGTFNTSASGIAVVDGLVPAQHLIGEVVDANGKWLPPFNAGFGLTPNHAGFMLMQLPRAANGKIIPVATYDEMLPGLKTPIEKHTQRWAYPIGTRFAEVVMGEDGIGEIRFREKKLDSAGKAVWESDVFRQYPSRQSLLARVQSMDDWESNPRLKQMASQLRSGEGNDVTIGSGFGNILTTPDGRKTGKLLGKSLVVPTDLTAAERKYLFEDKEMESSKGTVGWGLEGHHAFGPSVTNTGCLDCHRHAGEALRSIKNPTDTAAYGNFAGDDGILSMYFQDPARLGAFNVESDNRVYRSDFLKRSMIAPFDQRMKDSSLYPLIDR